MAPRLLSAAASLDSVWLELSYTRARLAGDPDAADFAPAIDPLLTEVEQIRIGQRRTWMGELEAQAQCDYLCGKLDCLVGDIAATLLFIDKDRRAPRVARYLKQSPHQIARLALRPKVELVREWPESLRTEREEALSVFGARLTELVERSLAALARQVTAGSERIDFRVRVINPLVDRVNAARFTLYGQLSQRAAEKRLGKYWPGRFFKAKAKSGRRQEEKPVRTDEAD